MTTALAESFTVLSRAVRGGVAVALESSDGQPADDVDDAVHLRGDGTRKPLP
jgi:hypothetical protein